MKSNEPCLSEQANGAPVILIVRTQGRQAADMEICRAAGWRPLLFSPQTLEPQAEALADLPAQYAQADAVFWVSPGAVQTGMTALPSSMYRDKPNIAVGSATARALREAGCRQVIAPADGQDSEAVLRLPFWQRPAAGSRLLVVGGEGGRNLLPAVLAGRGWQVARAAVYRRKPQALDWAAYRAARPIAAWITSAELVRLLFGQAPPELAQSLKSLLYLVHHSKIAQALYQAGATRVEVAERLEEHFLKSLHGVRNR